MKIAAPGYRFILAALMLVLLGWAMEWPPLTVLGLAAGAFLIYFFRDPERPIPAQAGAVVAPADGKVIFVDTVADHGVLKAPAKRVAIFMNVFDMHVNRAPVAGTVLDTQHHPGKFLAAFREDAAELNERQTWLIKDAAGRQLLMVQIAGLLARRIVPFAQAGQRLDRGQRLGMICFGSRVDLYLPLEAETTVKVGERVLAGSTVVAKFPEN